VALTLGRAWDLTERGIAALAANVGQGLLLSAAGDARRYEPTPDSPVIVARTDDPAGFLRAAGPLHVDGYELRLTACRPSRFGGALVEATGSRAHVEALVQRAGAPLESVPGSTEEDTYAALGLPYIPPEIRHGTDELGAAATGALPSLVTRTDIRGDLHLHTQYSDGQDGIEAVVRAAEAQGYEYIAFTDHSPTSAAARTLSIDSLARQNDEIDDVQARHPGIRILKGAEVDILPDAALDFPDAVLSRLDIVLASLHDPAGQDAPALLERYRRAAEHPLVNILTHPANQLVGRRGGYALDYDRLFELAAATGTALEIDGAPAHLDLDGGLARRAAAAGVTLSIDSDCHKAGLMGRYMAFGVGTARRGWIEATSVLNTRSIDEVLSFLRKKR
jgi:DNA polymerase (family 10)